MEDDLLRDLFAGVGPIAIRRMFGGKGIYVEGLIIALVAFDRLWIKTDAETQAQFEAAGAEPFVYDGRGKPVRMPYWSVPEEGIDDPDSFAVWARLGREAARRTLAGASSKRRRREARMPEDL